MRKEAGELDRRNCEEIWKARGEEESENLRKSDYEEEKMGENNKGGALTKSSGRDGKKQGQT